MRIVFCIDNNYAQMAKVSIESYKKHNPRAEIIVVSEEPMPKSIGYHRNVIIKLDRQFRNRGFGDRITNTTYLKLFLTKLAYQTILYVDADTICQKPLDDLFSLPCEYINLCESHQYGKNQAKAIGHEKYGLTGMMVMNLSNLRRINFTELCLDVEKNYPTPETGWQHDETCINVAMGNKLTFIDQKFNYCHNRTYTHPIPEQDAYILHYVGKDKGDMIQRSTYQEVAILKDKIKGKNVAIVGNAKSLFDKQYGEDIDDADFVIRFNRGFITRPECQGIKTGLLILACNLSQDEIKSYHAQYVANRSQHYDNKADFTIGNDERAKMKNYIGSQPSTGFMAIDICLFFEAKSINLYGFDFEATPTFYNPEGYQTQHDYAKEREIIKEYEKRGFVKINS